MNFYRWMKLKNPKYKMSDDSVMVRALREAFEAGGKHARDECAALADKWGDARNLEYGGAACKNLATAIRQLPNAALRGDSGLIAGVPLESTVMQEG